MDILVNFILPLLVALIGGGTFVTIFTLSEKKSSMVIENARALAESYKNLADEYESREASTQARCNSLEAKVDEQVRIISSLQHRLDDVHTKNAVLEVTHCECALTCPNKKPPLENAVKKFMQMQEGRQNNKSSNVYEEGSNN